MPWKTVELEHMTLDLRFDVGTARMLRDLTKEDPLLKEEKTETDSTETIAWIFLAAYKRGLAVKKLPSIYSDEVIRESAYELTMAESIDVVSMFNAALSVPLSPEAKAALEASKKEESQTEKAPEAAKKD